MAVCEVRVCSFNSLDAVAMADIACPISARCAEAVVSSSSSSSSLSSRRLRFFRFLFDFLSPSSHIWVRVFVLASNVFSLTGFVVLDNPPPTAIPGTVSLSRVLSSL
jgi:hypothetical protein